MIQACEHECEHACVYSLSSMSTSKLTVDGQRQNLCVQGRSVCRTKDKQLAFFQSSGKPLQKQHAGATLHIRWIA